MKKSWRKLSLSVLLLLAFSCLEMLGQSPIFSPGAWPANSSWVSYTLKGNALADPKTQDQSNGGTSPQNIANISSGTPDLSLPSAYVSYDGTRIFVRIRLESDPNAYNYGNVANSDPWNSALWTLFLDVNGDGWRDFAVFLDGSSGTSGNVIDRISVIYSALTTTQSVDYVANPSIYRIGQQYAARDSANKLVRYKDGNSIGANWSTGRDTLDFGTSRIINATASNGDYLFDFQIPIALFDAAPWGGPTWGSSSVFSASFTTANSLNDPFQKDFAYVGAFCASTTGIMAGGDPINFGNENLAKVVVMTVAATYCPTVQLTTSILTAQRVLNSGSCATQQVVSSVVDTKFYYALDINGNGVLDEVEKTWTLIGYGTPTTLGVWSYNWKTDSIPRGLYFIKVIANDTLNNVADSYDQTVAEYNNIYAVVDNNCGIIPATMAKTVDKSIVIANDPPAARTVTYTVTVTNPQATSIKIDTLTDVLPTGFKYQSTTGGTLYPPTTSPSLDATGTVRWTWSGGFTIAAGQSKTLVFTVLADTNSGTYYNSISAKGSTFFNSALNVAPVVVSRVSAAVTKSVSTPAGLVQGSQYSYTLNYQNTGSDTLKSAVLSDSLVQGITFVSATGGGSYNSSTRKVTWSLGNLLASASGSVSITFQVTNPYSGTNPLINTANLAASNLPNTAISNTVSSNVLGAVMNISKSVSPANANPGNNVTYTLLYGNVGTADAPNVVINDTLPSTLRYVVGTSTPAPTRIDTVLTPLRQILVYNAGTVTPGGGNLNNTISFQATVANPYPTPGSNQPLNNIAVIRSDVTNPYQTQATLYVTAIPVVALTKKSNKSIYAAGDTATFTFVLHNTGYYAATLDTLVDIFPSGFGYVSTTGGSLSPTSSPIAGATGTVRWRFSPAKSINPGVKDSLIFRAKVALGNATYTNTAVARGVLVSALQDTVATTLPITIASGIESINKTVEKTTGFQNDTLTYTLNYVNNTGGNITRTIVDTLSTYLTFVSQSNDGSMTFTQNGQALSWQRTNIPNGTSIAITIKARVITANVTIPNKGALNTTPATYTNTVATVIQSPPSMTLNKSVNVTKAPVGTELTYTISYSNAPGVAASTNTIITDTIPGRMTYVAGSATGGGSFLATPSPRGRVVWSLGTVNANSNGSVTFKVTIDSGAPNDTVITNTARLTNDEATNLSSFARDTVANIPHLTLVKSVNVTSVGPADTLIYTLKYTNTGSARAYGVSIKDTIPSSTLFVSANRSGIFSGIVVKWDSTSLGSVAVGATDSVILKVRLPKPMTLNSVSQLQNRAVIYSNGISALTSNTALTNVLYPQLAVVKSVDSTTIYAGNTMKYSIVISNSTIVAADSTYITDWVPSTLAYIPNTTKVNNVLQSDIGGNSPVVTGLNVGTVTSSTSKTVEFQLRVIGNIDNNSIIKDTAHVITAKLTNMHNSNVVQTTVYSAPRLWIRKTASATGNTPGSTITYTIKYGNIGTDTLTTIAIYDTIPNYTTYVASSLTGSATINSPDNTVISATPSSIQAGDTSFVFTFQVTVNNPMPVGTTDIYNKAIGSSNNGGSYRDSTLTQIVGSSTLTITKSASALGELHGLPTPRDTITYTINYSLTGNAFFSNMLLRDTLQSGLTYIASSGGGTNTGQAVEWNLGTLNPSSGSVTMTAYSSTVDSFVNWSSIKAAHQSSWTRSDTTKTKIIARPRLTIAKTANNSTPLPGDQVTYTVTVYNYGGATAGFVSFVDIIPGTVTYVPASITIDAVSQPDSGGVVTITETQVTISLTTVNVGQTKAITYKYQVR
ncbi:MAG: hypothetical protein V1799_19705 [bacterium]